MFRKRIRAFEHINKLNEYMNIFKVRKGGYD